MSAKDDSTTKRGTDPSGGPTAKRLKSDDDLAPLPVVPGMDTGRDITIKQESFPVPLLDIEHFSGLSEEDKKHPRRYLNEPVSDDDHDDDSLPVVGGFSSTRSD